MSAWADVCLPLLGATGPLWPQPKLEASASGTFCLERAVFLDAPRAWSTAKPEPFIWAQPSSDVAGLASPRRQRGLVGLACTRGPLVLRRAAEGCLAHHPGREGRRMDRSIVGVGV